jgi:hypothetical protein
VSSGAGGLGAKRGPCLLHGTLEMNPQRQEQLRITITGGHDEGWLQLLVLTNKQWMIPERLGLS